MIFRLTIFIYSQISPALFFAANNDLIAWNVKKAISTFQETFFLKSDIKYFNEKPPMRANIEFSKVLNFNC